MRKRTVVIALGACLALAVGAGPAGAGSKLFFGFAEDGPKWHGDGSVAPARVLGAEAFRLTVPWEPGETIVSGTTAEALDQAAAAAYGLLLVLAVYGDAADAPLDPTRRTEYCAYVRSLLERYPTVNDVVIWNEPNSSRFWAPQFNADGTSAAPAAYAALLAECWDALHAFRPEVNLLAPATSAHGFDDEDAPRKSHSPVNFIFKVGEAYRASGRDRPLFDTVAHHAYGLTSAERPWKRHDGHVVGQGDWDKLQNALRFAFAGTAQRMPGECEQFDCLGIWYTEIGYQVVPDSKHAAIYHGVENERRALAAAGVGDRDDAGDADSLAPDQATQIVDAVRLAFCQPYVDGFFNFLLRDEADLRGWQSGVQWANGEWKPSMAAFRRAIREAHDRSVNCASLKGGALPVVDATPPATPSRVTAAQVRAGVKLRWAMGSERDLAGYRVYRAERGPGPDTLLTELVRATRYVDETAVAGTTYSYFVAAMDSAGNESWLSAPVTARR